MALLGVPSCRETELFREARQYTLLLLEKYTLLLHG